MTDDDDVTLADRVATILQGIDELVLALPVAKALDVWGDVIDYGVEAVEALKAEQ